jgi:hypothetical protein
MLVERPHIVVFEECLMGLFEFSQERERGSGKFRREAVVIELQKNGEGERPFAPFSIKVR